MSFFNYRQRSLSPQGGSMSDLNFRNPKKIPELSENKLPIVVQQLPEAKPLVNSPNKPLEK
jgi:hypothetical protein